jgi:hypothetical protein
MSAEACLREKERSLLRVEIFSSPKKLPATEQAPALRSHDTSISLQQKKRSEFPPSVFKVITC